MPEPEEIVHGGLWEHEAHESYLSRISVSKSNHPPSAKSQPTTEHVRVQLLPGEIKLPPAEPKWNSWLVGTYLTKPGISLTVFETIQQGKGEKEAWQDAFIGGRKKQ